MNKIFTREEVSKHRTVGDAWLIVGEYVVDVTAFLAQHPGGSIVLVELLGRDATTAFEQMGHSNQAYEKMLKMAIGKVKAKS